MILLRISEQMITKGLSRQCIVLDRNRGNYLITYSMHVLRKPSLLKVLSSATAGSSAGIGDAM